MKNKILLHICCAPDATYPFTVLSKEFEVMGYFYGSNIHPKDEYDKRLEAVVKLSKAWSFPTMVDKYDPQRWLKEVEGLENEPEGGKRCQRCFYIQLKRATEIAKEENIAIFTTTLTISPHKDVKLINEIGKELAKEAGLIFLDIVFRKKGGFKRSVELSKELGLYRQNYCGCVFSLKGGEKGDGTG